MAAARLGRKLYAARTVAKHNVCKQEPDTRIARKLVERVLTVSCQHHRIAKLRQAAGRMLAHKGIILDDEDRTCLLTRRRTRPSLVYIISGATCLRRPRKKEAHRRTLPRYRLDTDMAARLEHKSMYHA